MGERPVREYRKTAAQQKQEVAERLAALKAAEARLVALIGRLVDENGSHS